MIISLSDRNRGVGFDQLVVIKSDKSSDLNLTFYNADGSQIATCGNATRCVAQYEMRRVGKEVPQNKDDQRHTRSNSRGFS